MEPKFRSDDGEAGLERVSPGGAAVLWPRRVLGGGDFDGDFAAALAVLERAVVGGGYICDWNNGVDDGLQFARVDEFGDFEELLLIWLDDEERLFSALVVQRFSFRTRGNGDYVAAELEHAKRALERFAADTVENDVDISRDVFKALRGVVDELVGTQLFDEIAIPG